MRSEVTVDFRKVRTAYCATVEFKYWVGRAAGCKRNGARACTCKVKGRRCVSRMVKHAGSRVFHGVMVVPCAVLCLVAIISFGTFASKHNEIGKKLDKAEQKYPDVHSNRCILFATTKYNSVFLSGGRACVVAIWSEVFVALLALLLGVVFSVKVAIGVNA